VPSAQGNRISTMASSERTSRSRARCEREPADWASVLGKFEVVDLDLERAYGGARRIERGEQRGVDDFSSLEVVLVTEAACSS
jgi:hypothetical protein